MYVRYVCGVGVCSDVYDRTEIWTLKKVLGLGDSLSRSPAPRPGDSGTHRHPTDGRRNVVDPRFTRPTLVPLCRSRGPVEVRT